ncbi:MAG: nickel-dependent lactate racemase [Anaerolineae bacterium]|nr:nickel-dependent lactate racemase [Anaerolineae bacterium]
MPIVHLPYGQTSLTIELPETLTLEHLSPHETAPAPDARQAVEQALAAPTGGVRRLEDFAGARSAAIAVNDKTRPVPHAELLPPLLARLEALGIPREGITLVIATGTHPVMPPEEYPWILPEAILRAYRIVCHDSQDDRALVHLGQTPHGTPVSINRHYWEADLHLAVGNVEPHQFMGFSGGVKSVAIGVAGKGTINHNHALMQDPGATLGSYQSNPARQDVEEIGRLMRVDFVVNAVLNGKKQIVEVFAGEPQAVMQAAIPRVRAVYQVPVSTPYDLMLVSPGGHPKDINVYQSQKGMAHAALVMRPGGTLILCASCPEGSGSQSYENWVNQVDSQAAVFERFAAEGFRVGPHKAFQIARDSARIRVFWVTDMPDSLTQKLLLENAAWRLRCKQRWPTCRRMPGWA